MKSPRGKGIRPTADRVRESIFAIIGPFPFPVRVLDLFAGTGALGLEALSRGAARAVFVDSGRMAKDCILANGATLGFSQQMRMVHSEVSRYLEKARGAAFDLVFMDPPYGTGQVTPTLITLGTWPLLSDEALVVVEHDMRDEAPQSEAGLTAVDARRYRDTMITFYKRIR